MALFLRASNRALLKYVAPEKNLILLARPVTMKIADAPSPPQVGYDDRNMKIGRPMSPHLTIYKPQWTSFLSITHRATGMGLGTYLTALGLGAIVLPQTIDHYLDNLHGIGWFTHSFLKMMIAFPLCYHYINGIRHLTWDFGKFLSIKQVYATGFLMLGLSIVSSVFLTLM